jgi:hypothetical protein
MKGTIHPHNKSVPKTSDKGGKLNQYGEHRILEGSKAGHTGTKGGRRSHP